MIEIIIVEAGEHSPGIGNGEFVVMKIVSGDRGKGEARWINVSFHSRPREDLKRLSASVLEVGSAHLVNYWSDKKAYHIPTKASFSGS